MGASAQTSPERTLEVATCPSCGTELQGKFCQRCGEKEFHARELSIRHFLEHALEEFTHLDSKAFATLRYLFTRPGFLTTEFIAGRKTKYMKPLSLFLVASALLLLANSIRARSPYDVHWLTQVDQARNGELSALLTRLSVKKSVAKEVLIDRIQEREHRLVTTAEFAIVLAVAVVLALLYRRHFFVEHLVASLHYFSFNFLCWVLLWPIATSVGVFNLKSTILLVFTTIVFFIYLVIALRRIYGQPAGVTIAKTAVLYAGILLFQIMTPVVALLVSLISVARA